MRMVISEKSPEAFNQKVAEIEELYVIIEETYRIIICGGYLVHNLYIVAKERI